jgi:hypothetical protein
MSCSSSELRIAESIPVVFSMYPAHSVCRSQRHATRKRVPRAGYILATLIDSPVLTILAVVCAMIAIGNPLATADEPPAINPFGRAAPVREDALPGCVELSDGSVHPGQVYLTRDKRLQLYDEKLQRQREVPLEAVQQIDCAVRREWKEKEWRFKETTSDEKMYTGRAYPAREYVHTIVLRDGRTMTGSLSGVVYVQPPEDNSAVTGKHAAEPERYILRQRDKGELNAGLPSLVYVKCVKLGKEAYDDGRRRAAEQISRKARPQ